MADIESKIAPETVTETELRLKNTLGKRLVAWTRYFVVVPVLGLFVAAVVLTGKATLDLVSTVTGIFQDAVSTKDALVNFVELADVYLLAVVLYIIALGLYELFVDDDLPLPSWLEFHHLDDLEKKLLQVVVVVLAVYFLGQVLKARSDDFVQVAYLGVGIGAVFASIGVFLWAMSKLKKS